MDDVLSEIIRWSKVEFNYFDGFSGEPGTVADEDEDLDP